MPSLFQHYPELAQLDDTGVAIIKQAQRIKVPSNTVLFHQGDLCNNFIIVVSGTVKVLGRNSSGREIILYRIEEKGTCVLTTSCLLGHQRYPAEGVSETEVQAYLLPLDAFTSALNDSPGLRNFIFSSYASPLSEMIELIQSIAFESIESRLIEYILTHTDSSLEVKTSHQQIADTLGTAREVVSRHLKKLETQGLIRLKRGCIIICDLDHLGSVT